MEVSLIITCHKQHIYLKQLIQLLEKYLDLEKEVEVIIADSTEEEILIPSYLHYYKIPNHGPSCARNFAVSKATGNWVIFCDADDFVNPFVIRHISRFVEQQPDADAFFFDFRREEDKGIIDAAEKQFDAFHQPVQLQFQPVTEPLLFLQKFFPVHAVLIKRNVFQNIRFNEPQWFIEDVRFYLELALIPEVKIKYCNDVSFNSFHRFFNERKTLSSSNETLFWEGVGANYQFLAAHSKLSTRQKFKLVKLLILNYHTVNKAIKKIMLKKNKTIWKYFFGLPVLLRNRILFKAVISVTRLGR